MKVLEAPVADTAEREDLAEKASEFLLGVLERMGISADIDIKDDNDKTKPGENDHAFSSVVRPEIHALP